jgi:hypothetical protein
LPHLTLFVILRSLGQPSGKITHPPQQPSFRLKAFVYCSKSPISNYFGRGVRRERRRR